MTEHTPGQTWLKWAKVILIAGMFFGAAALIAWVYVRFEHGFWLEPDATTWVLENENPQADTNDLHSMQDAYRLVRGLFYTMFGFVIVGALVNVRGYRMRSVEKSQEQQAEKDALELAHQRQLESLDYGHGFGKGGLKALDMNLKGQMDQLAASVNGLIIIKREEAQARKGRAKQQSQDELDLLDGLMAQLEKVNAAAAKDPVFGQQVWGQWQKQKPDRSNSI